VVLSPIAAHLASPISGVLAAASDETTVNPILALWPVLLLGVAFYMLAIRPQRRRTQALREFQANLTVGDEVNTVGGIIGVISSLSEHEAMVDVGGVQLKFARGAIAAPARGRSE